MSLAGRMTVGLAVFLALVLGLGWLEFKRRVPREQVIEVAIVPSVPGTGTRPAANAPAPSGTAARPPQLVIMSPGAGTAATSAPPAEASASAPTPPPPAPTAPPPPSVPPDASRAPDPVPTPADAAGSSAETAGLPSPATSDAAPDSASAPTPAPAAAASAEGPPPPAPAADPRFDVVRVDGGGSVVAAGRAPAGSTIEMVLGDKTIDRTVADAAGQWVMVPASVLPPGSHQLALRGGTGVPSQQTVSVSVPAKASGRSQVFVNEPGKPTVGPGTEIATVPAAAGEGLQLRPVDGTTPVDGTEPPATLAPNTEAAAAQPMPSPAAPVPGGVAIDALDAVGTSFTMHGRGPPGAPLRIYFNDTVVAEPTVGKDGSWSLTVQRGFVSGEYRIRIDQIERDGHVIASVNRVVEHTPGDVAQTAPASGAPVSVQRSAQRPSSAAATTPSARADPPGEATSAETAPSEPGAIFEGPARPATAGAPPDTGTPPDAAAAATGRTVPPPSDVPPGSRETAAAAADASDAGAAKGDGADPANVVIRKLATAKVQRGDTLWVLSRRAYGRGKLYSIIYRANRDRIRVPRLIYPNQVLVMPTREPS